MMWLVLFVLGCIEGYNNHDLELLTAYRAKDMCSCVFVQGRDEVYCRDWTKASPNLASLSVDMDCCVCVLESMCVHARVR